MEKQLREYVKKGEKGIQILAPTPYKIKVDKEKLDPDTKLPMLDDEGKPITEEKEVTIPMFKVVSVFDVNGKLLVNVHATHLSATRNETWYWN